MAPKTRAEPFGLLRSLLLLPLDEVPLDLAEHSAVLAAVELFGDRVGVVVLVEGLARRELDAAAPSRRNRIAIRRFPGFDYLRYVSIVTIHFWLEPTMEAAGIEPASEPRRDL